MLVVTRNEVQTTMTTYFGNDDLFYTSTVSFKNVGDVTVTNLQCKHSSIDENSRNASLSPCLYLHLHLPVHRHRMHYFTDCCHFSFQLP